MSTLSSRDVAVARADADIQPEDARPMFCNDAAPRRPGSARVLSLPKVAPRAMAKSLAASAASATARRRTARWARLSVRVEVPAAVGDRYPHFIYGRDNLWDVTGFHEQLARYQRCPAGLLADVVGSHEVEHLFHAQRSHLHLAHATPSVSSSDAQLSDDGVTLGESF